MKKLIIVRHAKAEVLIPGNTDFNRKLTSSGKQDAEKMALRLKEKIDCPHLFISSDAKRAFSTAKRFASAFEMALGKINIEHKIYDASLDTLVELVQQINNEYESAIIFGHNPGFSQLVYFLAENGGVELPTCGLCIIQFQLDDWTLIDRGKGKIVYFERP